MAGDYSTYEEVPMPSDVTAALTPSTTTGLVGLAIIVSGNGLFGATRVVTHTVPAKTTAGSPAPAAVTVTVTSGNPAASKRKGNV